MDAKKKLTKFPGAVGCGEGIVNESYPNPIAETSQLQKRRVPQFDGLKGAFVEVDPDWHRPQEDVETWLRGDV